MLVFGDSGNFGWALWDYNPATKLMVCVDADANALSLIGKRQKWNKKAFGRRNPWDAPSVEKGAGLRFSFTFVEGPPCS